MKFVNLVKNLTFLFGFQCALLIFASPVLACDCDGPRGKLALVEADAAFRGTITNIEFLDSKTAVSEPRIIVTFSVSRVWKGDVKTTFLLHTKLNSWGCGGFYFEDGKEYLVFAYSTDGKATEELYGGAKNTFGTHTCSGTTLIEKAEEDLRELGNGKKPKHQI